MKNRLFTLTTCLLVALVLVGGLAACQREAPRRDLEPTATEQQAGVGASVETPLPGQTVISAISPVPQGTPGVGAELTPETGSLSPTAAVETPGVLSGPTPIPPGEGYVVYTIQPGDTLSDVARSYATTVDAIVAANNIADAAQISPGQQIKIPTTSGAGQPVATTQPSSGACGKWVNSGGCRYLYTVKPGDWIYQIARTCGVEPGDIISANKSKLANPSIIPPGLVLCIP